MKEAMDGYVSHGWVEENILEIHDGGGMGLKMVTISFEQLPDKDEQTHTFHNVSKTWDT